MISKNKIRFISSLQTKKIRDEENLFTIEGEKVVAEFLEAGMRFKILAAVPGFISTLPPYALKQIEIIEPVGNKELRQMSSFKTPHNALAVLEKLDNGYSANNISGKIAAALDCIQDPGNLGTIIRAAAWFGIDTLICSPDCVDIYNPKVIQASMGAILHVKVHYTDLAQYFKINKTSVFGALLEGNSIYNQSLENEGIILLGNESKGISDELLPFITHKISIPGVSGKPGIDSLNVGMAASIIFSEFYRKR